MCYKGAILTSCFRVFYFTSHEGLIFVNKTFRFLFSFEITFRYPRTLSSELALTPAHPEIIDQVLDEILCLPASNRQILRKCKHCSESFVCKCRLENHMIEYHWRRTGIWKFLFCITHRWIFCQKNLFFPRPAKKLWKKFPIFFTFRSGKFF